MPKDTKSLGNNKAPACESRGFVHKKRGVHFDTPPNNKYRTYTLNYPIESSKIPYGSIFILWKRICQQMLSL